MTYSIYFLPTASPRFPVWMRGRCIYPIMLASACLAAAIQLPNTNTQLAGNRSKVAVVDGVG